MRDNFDEKDVNNNMSTKNRKYDEYGYDEEGYDKKGYDIRGYDKEGYNVNGYDRKGFDKKGINIYTGTKYDPKGYNVYGFDKKGHTVEGYTRNQEGYDKRGFNKKGIHKKTNEKYDEEGYDKNGYNEEGYNRRGYNKEGYDREGFDRKGFDKNGINRDGLTIEEQNEMKDTEKEKNKAKTRGVYLGLIGKIEKLVKGEMSIEDYIKSSKMNIDDLIKFAKKQGMSADIIKGLNKQRSPYKLYSKPFSKKDYLASAMIMIGDKEVKPTEQDVDKCIEYLQANERLVCDKTVRELIRQYLKGEVDVNLSQKSKLAQKEQELQKFEKEKGLIDEIESAIDKQQQAK